MVDQTSFLGMPLRTQRQRRLLVVLYYAVLVGFAAIGLWMDKKGWGSLVAQTFTFGGLLGGIRMGGPVKAYDQPDFPLDRDTSIHTLNIEGRKPFDTSLPEAWVPLDERERTQRDMAHYTAYRILRWSFGLFVLVYFVVTLWDAAWLADRTLFLLWLFLLYVLSLPQSVVLWTEPQPPAEELAEVPAPAR